MRKPKATDPSKYDIVIFRSWLDRAKTKPVYEAHVLCKYSGHSVIGQGPTPNRAEKDAREALAFVLEGNPEVVPMEVGGSVVIKLEREGLSVDRVRTVGQGAE